jgi:hypothetical protein
MKKKIERTRVDRKAWEAARKGESAEIFIANEGPNKPAW